MILKSSQQKVVSKLETFFQQWKDEEGAYLSAVQTLRTAGQESIISSIKQPITQLYEKVNEYKDF